MNIIFNFIIAFLVYAAIRFSLVKKLSGKEVIINELLIGSVCYALAHLIIKFLSEPTPETKDEVKG